MNKIYSSYKEKKNPQIFVQYFLDKNSPKNPPTLTESHTDLPLSTAIITCFFLYNFPCFHITNNY